MCGIFGSINKDFTNLRPDLAIKVLLKRGPDCQSTFKDIDKNVLLGHTRLAIIDLSADANQPMHSVDQRYTIVYNGEIYNFRDIKSKIGNEYDWKSNSDTEVILAAYIKWGPKCLKEFHGMFAFAIWDSVTNELFAARDRLGVKPFYYSLDEDSFIFASRPKVFFEYVNSFKSELNKQAIRYYLESGYIPGSLSIYEKINKLEPGHYLEYSDCKLGIHKYWSINKVSTDRSLTHIPVNQMISKLDQLISESVEQRMISNVPLGAFLSGGIDSSLVVAVMSKLSSTPINTFTIGFDDKNYDESEHALNVSNHLGTKHYQETLKANDLIDLVPTFFDEYDEPFFDYSAFPTMAVSRLAAKEVKVSLIGDGGDEAFGGYHYYNLIGNINKIYKFPKFVRNIANLIFAQGGRNLKMLGGSIVYNHPSEAFAYIRSVMKSNKFILNNDYFIETTSIHQLFYKTFEDLSDNSIEESGMRLDINHTLPDDYLVKVDRASMAFSIEAREPLLDHSILEWAATLPYNWKSSQGINKYLLRELAYTYIPKSILDRPKMGFRVPIAQWLRNELKSWATNLIDDTPLMDSVGINVESFRSLWNQHQTGKNDHHTIIWTVLVLLQFIRTNKENIL